MGKIKYTERALGVLATFDSGLQATWNRAVSTEWSFANNMYSFTCNGDTSITPYNQVSAWGTNRFGQNFMTHYILPVMCNNFCGFTQPLSGKVVHNVNNATFTVTLGVDNHGSTYTGTDCPFGYKIDWVLPNSSGTGVFSYR